MTLESLTQTGKREKLFFFIYSLMFGIAALFTASAYRQFSDMRHFLDYPFKVLSLRNILIFALGIFVGYVIICFAYSFTQKTKKEADYRNPAFVSFCLNFIMFMVQFALFFPGTGMNDTVNCLIAEKSGMIPFVFNYCIYHSFWLLTNVTGDATTAYAIITLLQILICDLIIARFIDFLYKQKISGSIVYLSVIFFAFFPIIGNYSICILKDTWFSIAFLYMVPHLYRVIRVDESDEKENVKPLAKTEIYNLLGLLLAFFGLWISRANGKAIVIAIAIAVILLRKKSLYMALFGAVIVVFMLASVLVNGKIKAETEDCTFREAASVCFAQIGFTLEKEKGEYSSFSDEDLEVLNNILPIDDWTESICFSFVDKIKFNSNFNNEYLNEHKADFIKIWVKGFMHNPYAYFQSYLYHTYGFWNLAFFRVTSIDQTQSTFFSVVNNTGWDSYWGEYCKEIGLADSPLVDDSMYMIGKNIYWVLTNGCMLFSAGILFWIELLVLFILMALRKYREALTCLPFIVCFLTLMIFSPSGLIYRYSFYELLTFPYFIALIDSVRLSKTE